MDYRGYVGAASCRISGIHRLDQSSGRCVICQEEILRPRAPVATETLEKKGAATNRPLPSHRFR